MNSLNGVSLARTVDPEKYAAKRRHILNSAAVLFAERGYERTTTDQLCAAARVSPGSLYHYFSGKKQLFIAVLTEDEQDTAALLQQVAVHPDPLEGLLQFVVHLAQPASAHPVVPKLVLEAVLQAHRDEQIASELGRIDQQESAGLRMLLQRATEAGAVDPGLDPEQSTSWIAALINALYLQAALDPDVDPEQQSQYLIRTVQAFLRTPAAP